MTDKTTFRPTRKGLTAALHALGADSDQVAETLRVGGHRGNQEDCYTCPVALYLLSVIDGATRADVNTVECAVWIGGASVLLPAAARIQTPLAVAAFVSDFDDGADYIDLAVFVDDFDAEVKT